MESLKPVKGTKYDYSSAKLAADSAKPCFTINDTDLPAINKWKVGEKYKLTIEVEMTGVREASDMAKPQGNQADFEMIAVAPYEETTSQMRKRLTSQS